MGAISFICFQFEEAFSAECDPYEWHKFSAAALNLVEWFYNESVDSTFSSQVIYERY